MVLFETELTGIIKTITILDIVDILVVTFFLYKLYQMLKNTRATALIKGLTVLLLAMLLSKWLHLYVINWILVKSLTVLMIALPVVFQPELRRALEQIGRGKLFRKSTILDEEEVDKMLTAVASVGCTMARKRIGALIVFERDTGLNDYIETGIKVDALVSEELFMNIFIPSTPLHDGAVIMRGNRISAASCILPLTDTRHLSQELGTRHRAAIGMSEQSDAVVFVVSEETGTMSIAKGGSLQRFLTENDVKTLIKEVISTPTVGWKDELKMKWEKWRNKDAK